MYSVVCLCRKMDFNPIASAGTHSNVVNDDVDAAPRVHVYTTASSGTCRTVVTDVVDVPPADLTTQKSMTTCSSPDAAMPRRRRTAFNESLTHSSDLTEQFDHAIRGSLRLMFAIVGPCLVAAVGLAVITAFTLTTTTEGNLLHAFIVRGYAEVHLQCDEWERLVTCQAKAQHSPLVQILALPSVFRFKILEALIWLTEAAAIIMGTRLLFPYHWDRRISVMVVGLQVLS